MILISHAIEPNDITASSTDLTNDSLAQLDLNRDNRNENDHPDKLDLYLEVRLNGADRGLASFEYYNDQLWASINVLQQLGFILPPDTIEPIPLNTLSDIKIDYDARQQTVNLIAPLSILNLATTVVNTRNSRHPQPTASPGFLLNYNLYGTQTENNATSLSAYTELRSFNDFGVLSSTALTTGNRFAGSDTNSNDWDSRTVRLDSSWSKSFPDKLVTVSAGDLLTGTLSWTRSTRLGGLQFGTNFDLQPYMTTTPLPSFFGSATLPSTVELYINVLSRIL